MASRGNASKGAVATVPVVPSRWEPSNQALTAVTYGGKLFLFAVDRDRGHIFYTWSELGTFTGNDYHPWQRIIGVTTFERVAAAGFPGPANTSLLYVFVSPGPELRQTFYTTHKDPTQIAASPWARWNEIPIDNLPPGSGTTTNSVAPAVTESIPAYLFAVDHASNIWSNSKIPGSNVGWDHTWDDIGQRRTPGGGATDRALGAAAWTHNDPIKPKTFRSRSILLFASGKILLNDAHQTENDNGIYFRHSLSGNWWNNPWHEVGTALEFQPPADLSPVHGQPPQRGSGGATTLPLTGVAAGAKFFLFAVGIDGVPYQRELHYQYTSARSILSWDNAWSPVVGPAWKQSPLFTNQPIAAAFFRDRIFAFVANGGRPWMTRRTLSGAWEPPMRLSAPGGLQMYQP